jgi:adenylyltransferase/sulfurtransferase
MAAGLEVSYSQQLLLFDALCGSFRTIKLRPRQLQCAVCGDNPSITALIDYELFCGSRADDKDQSVQLLAPEHRVSCQEYSDVVRRGQPHILLDVREEVEYHICHLPHSRSILHHCPYSVCVSSIIVCGVS